MERGVNDNSEVRLSTSWVDSWLELQRLSFVGSGMTCIGFSRKGSWKRVILASREHQ